ncbi:uncharacterized protein LOC144177997 [Haemaphysalis longicornis]
MSRFCTLQALLVFPLFWPATVSCSTTHEIPRKSAYQDDSIQPSNHTEPDFLPLMRSVGCASTSSMAISAPGDDINNSPPRQPFSGHGSIHGFTADMSRFCTLQVCKQYSLYAKKSDNRFLFLLPCPQVLCEVAGECVSMALLLLRSGDVETNPGPPKTRSAAIVDVDTLPDEPSEQMNVIFQLLKDLQSRSVESSDRQAEIIADVKAIQTSIGQIENKIGCIQSRLDALAEKMEKYEPIDQTLTTMQDSIETLSTQHGAQQSRVDELEDRSRRNNLLFHGIPDSRETWQQSEDRIKEALTGVDDAESINNSIERAHRLGTFMPNKGRPIIVKFSSYKMKDKILSARTKLKEKDVSVTEDFCPATRYARKQLIDFAKCQPNAPQFKLQYKKLLLNKKQYMYDPQTESVTEHTKQVFDLNQSTSESSPNA